jgi:hypothetical protein
MANEHHVILKLPEGLIVFAVHQKPSSEYGSELKFGTE